MRKYLLGAVVGAFMMLASLVVADVVSQARDQVLTPGD
jgi:hypothetical protein